MKGHYGQGVFNRKAFSWRLAYRFSPWSSWREVGQHCSPERFTLWSIGRDTKPGLGFGNVKARPQWHTTSNKATLPNPPQMFFQLGTKHSNIWAHGSHCCANYHSCRCLKFTPSDVLPLERLYLNRFHDFLKQHHQLKTKCSNTGTYGGHISFKPTHHLSLWHLLYFLYRYCASEQANKQTDTSYNKIIFESVSPKSKDKGPRSLLVHGRIHVQMEADRERGSYRPRSTWCLWKLDGQEGCPLKPPEGLVWGTQDTLNSCLACFFPSFPERPPEKERMCFPTWGTKLQLLVAI